MRAALLGYTMGLLASRIAERPLILYYPCEESIAEGAAAFSSLVHMGYAPVLRRAVSPEEAAAWVEAESPDLVLACTSCRHEWVADLLRTMASKGMETPVLLGPDALPRGPIREALSEGAVSRWARGRLYIASLDRDRGLVTLNRANPVGGRLELEPMVGILAPAALLLQ